MLEGIAVVTGAASGIGRECAFAYAAEGAKGVVFADLNETASSEAATESKKFAIHPEYRTLSVAVDVSSESSVNALVEKTVQEFGSIQYWVNSAGLGVQKPAEVAEASISEFDAFYNVNVKGTFICTQAASKAMKSQERMSTTGRNGTRDIGRGVIINMGSCNSFVATPQIIQYTTAKHAILGLTRNAALDNAPYGIRVNSVCPSWVDTPMIDRAIAGNPSLATFIENAVPLGRIAKQEEVSGLVMFLSSPNASYVTGVGWIVDGGTTLSTLK